MHSDFPLYLQAMDILADTVLRPTISADELEHQKVTATQVNTSWFSSMQIVLIRAFAANRKCIFLESREPILT